MSWDGENGVWAGDKATGAPTEDLPKPLYLFGYGSLIWRSGDVLAGMKTYHCMCKSWCRVFAQKSMDHRGRPVFPGLVLNLLSYAYLVERNRDHQKNSTSSCIGVIYHIPDERIEEIVAELDYRERGGYERRIVEVELLEDTKTNKKGDTIDVLVYIGAVDNPNFAYDPSKEWYPRKVNIISAAYGPSGHNHDYLFPLVQFFHDHKYPDPYLYQLEHDVRMRLGQWRGRSEDTARIADSAQECILEASGVPIDKEDCLHMYGWGSVEYGQLSIGSSVIAKKPHDNVFVATVIGGIGSSPKTRRQPCSSHHPRRYVVLAGGSHSGCLIDETLYLWGSQSQGQVGPGIVPSGVVGASLGHEHSLVLLRNGNVLSFGDDSFGQCSGVNSGAPYFLKYISSWPEAVLSTELPGEISDEAMLHWERLFAELGTNILETDPHLRARPRVVQVCAGIRHSAAITDDGSLFTWGGGRHASALLSGLEPWRPEPNGEGMAANVVDVALGCNHTVALDSAGRVWTWGSNNRHLQLGRPLESSLQPLPIALPDDVIWQRVTSGWSHSAARGVRSDGTICICIWGRADMGATGAGFKNGDQTLTAAGDGKRSSSEANAGPNDALPHELPPLLNSEAIEEVWCGSEYTLVSGSDGGLWSCGWNEHGNLGIGRSDMDISRSWYPVVCSSVESATASGAYPSSSLSTPQRRLLAVWDGALACGGGHCIAVMK